MGLYLDCDCSVESDGTIDFCELHGAAPEMLEALQELNRLWREGGSPRDEGDARHAARTAIAKATGKAP